MSGMQFWLTPDGGGKRLRLPVNPAVLSVKLSQGYQDLSIVALGERTVFGEAGLSEFAISSFFPRDYHPGYCEHMEFEPPWSCVQLVEGWMRARKPVTFDITGTTVEGVPTTIRSFSYEERAGSPGDLYYELALKQYRPVQAEPAAEQERKDGSPTPPAFYVVVAGDSLWKIAQRIWGDGDRWRELHAANQAAIGKDPNRLKVGLKLAVPA
ncbi:Phage-like element PBSX protein xkdP [Paenibacillus pasadenensis]|uniref:Phage-like element PBSX protein xkdP n=1 Tax=Paenibacillus pasadenensis TaxID=217090 RepID=A0A2N5N566_9BACL|nr:LysM peptidoglycan-binding domain-containing protein [Paenibacillus pasadenensis]PLT45488.1 Phage-like element PBSX protein xkdP [Paenibacillus pasadenensis]